MVSNQKFDDLRHMRTMDAKKLTGNRKITMMARIVAAGAAIYSDSRIAVLLQGTSAVLLMILMLACSLPALWFQYYSRNIGGTFIFYPAAATLSGLYVAFLLYHLLILIPADLIWILLRKLLRMKIPHKIFSLSACLLSMVITIYGRIHALQLKTVCYDVPTPKWEPGSEYRVVQLSDLHVGTIIGEKYIRKVVNETNRLRPDLVVITGDVFNRISANESAHPDRIFHLLSGLRAADGVYAVRGNHDPEADHPAWQHFLSVSGIQDLDNACVSAGPVTLAGRTGLARDPDRKPLTEILAASRANPYTIILDHDPRGIPEAAENKADLVLCGHTHDGQYFPCTLLTRCWYGRKYCHGISRTGETCSIVSSGTGYFQIPVRDGTDSEVVLIRIIGE